MNTERTDRGPTTMGYVCALETLDGHSAVSGGPYREFDHSLRQSHRAKYSLPAWVSRHGNQPRARWKEVCIGYDDRNTIPRGVAEYMKFGRPLSKRLEQRLQRVLEELQAKKEVTLYSYPKMVVDGLVELRAAETKSRAQITVEAERAGFSADDAERLFITQTMKIVGGRASGVIQSLSRLTTDAPRREKETAYGFDYLSASTLMALALFWFDVTEQMMQNGITGFSPFMLDFAHLDFEDVENIFDVLSSAHRLYDRVARFLRTVGPQHTQAATKARTLANNAKYDARALSADADRLAADAAHRTRDLFAEAANRSREAADEARLLEAKAPAAKEDSKIASLNMIGIQSLAVDLRIWRSSTAAPVNLIRTNRLSIESTCENSIAPPN